MRTIMIAQSSVEYDGQKSQHFKKKKKQKKKKVEI